MSESLATAASRHIDPTIFCNGEAARIDAAAKAAASQALPDRRGLQTNE